METHQSAIAGFYAVDRESDTASYMKIPAIQAQSKNDPYLFPAPGQTNLLCGMPNLVGGYIARVQERGEIGYIAEIRAVAIDFIPAQTMLKKRCNVFCAPSSDGVQWFSSFCARDAWAVN